MCWAACETYQYALEDTTCFLWHGVQKTKRIERCRFGDMEEADQYTSSSKSDFSCKYHHLSVGGKQELITGR